MNTNFSIERGNKTMFFVSDIFIDAPKSFQTDLQQKVYKTLNELNISFERVDTDEAITMEDCIKINEILHMKMVKTLFLCNRQKTEFYLFITTAEKAFRAKDFSHAFNISRVSFAPADLMQEMLQTKIGAATIFSALIDSDNIIKIVIDNDVAKEEWYGCSDGTTTGYMKIKTTDIVDKFLPYTNHKANMISI